MSGYNLPADGKWYNLVLQLNSGANAAPASVWAPVLAMVRPYELFAIECLTLVLLCGMVTLSHCYTGDNPTQG